MFREVFSSLALNVNPSLVTLMSPLKSFAGVEVNFRFVFEILSAHSKSVVFYLSNLPSYFHRQLDLVSILECFPSELTSFSWINFCCIRVCIFQLQLDFDPQLRATAAECLLHPWLTGDEAALTKRLLRRDDEAGAAKDDSSSDLEGFLASPAPARGPDADYSDEGGDEEEEEEEEDWQSTSDPNNTHSTNSESGGVNNADFVSAHDEIEDAPSPSPSSFLDPALLLGTLEDFGLNMEGYAGLLPTSRPGGVPPPPARRGSRVTEATAPLHRVNGVNSGNNNIHGNDDTGSDDLEICDDDAEADAV